MAAPTDDLPAAPGPTPMPLIGRRGNELQFYRDMIGYMLALYRKYGTIATLVNGEPHWVFVFGPEHTRYVLTNADLFHARILTIPAPADSALQHITTGLLNMNGTQHKQHRRVIQPALQRQQVEQYRNDIVAITARTLERWRLGDQIDMAQEMQQLTMQVANRVLFGLDSNVAMNG